MTNVEAIETLRANYPDACFEQLREAVDVAIGALKAQPKSGKWIPQRCGGLCCSECGGYALNISDGNSINIVVPSNYCPHCGASMKNRHSIIVKDLN